jgi:hypothetical protein
MKVFMKWQRRMVVAVVLLLTASGAGWSGEARWLLLDSDAEHSDFYYDKGSIKRLPEGIISFQTKVIFTAKGKADALETLKNDAYKGLTWASYEYELNCDTQQSRLGRVVNYDGKGGVISEFKLTGKTKWEDVPVGSRLEMVSDQECPPQK